MTLVEVCLEDVGGAAIAAAAGAEAIEVCAGQPRLSRRRSGS
jgi:copper homeostasis protein